MLAQEKKAQNFAKMSEEDADIRILAAHGGAVLEVKRSDGEWHVVVGSKYARRIDSADTPTEITGPAAGHDIWIKTEADPSGRCVSGGMSKGLCQPVNGRGKSGWTMRSPNRACILPRWL